MSGRERLNFVEERLGIIDHERRRGAVFGKGGKVGSDEVWKNLRVYGYNYVWLARNGFLGQLNCVLGGESKVGIPI